MSNQATLEDRVTRLEELLSHHEHLLKQLNEVVLELREENARLQSRIPAELSRLESLIGDQGMAPDPNEKPPHY